MNEKSSKEKTIAMQYAELNKFGQNGEFERALKAANKSNTFFKHMVLKYIF